LVIFVDTSAWFALFVRDDRNSDAVRLWLRENRDKPLVTTDYVVDESLTLLRSRAPLRAVPAGEQLLSGNLTSIEFVQETDFHQAWDIFRNFKDKNWSFTDCTSRVVMARIGADSALAFDEHFTQFGTVSVVP
jgi:hypothetical protein